MVLKKIIYLILILTIIFFAFIGMIVFFGFNKNQNVDYFYGLSVKPNEFSKVKTFKCIINKRVDTKVDQNGKVDIAIKNISETQNIDLINIENGTARFPSDTPPEATVIYNEEGYTFIGKSYSGNYLLTTVFSPYPYDQEKSYSKFFIVSSGHVNTNDKNKQGWTWQDYGMCVITDLN